MTKAKEWTSDIWEYLVGAAALIGYLEHIIGFAVLLMTFIMTFVRFKRFLRNIKDEKNINNNSHSSNDNSTS